MATLPTPIPEEEIRGYFSTMLLDYLRIDRQLEEASQEGMPVAQRSERREKKVGILLQEARDFGVKPSRLQEWLGDLEAEPPQKSRFADAIASSHNRENREALRKAAVQAAELERNLAAKREQKMTDLIEEFAISPAALAEAIRKEKPEFEQRRDHLADYQEALENSLGNLKYQRHNVATPQWVARRYLLFTYAQQTEREEEAARISNQVLAPRGLSAEYFEKYLAQENPHPEERAAFHRALFRVQAREEENGRDRSADKPVVKSLTPHLLYGQGNEANDAQLRSLLGKRLDYFLRLDADLENQRAQSFQKSVRQNSFDPAEYEAALSLERATFDPQKSNLQALSEDPAFRHKSVAQAALQEEWNSSLFRERKDELRRIAVFTQFHAVPREVIETAFQDRNKAPETRERFWKELGAMPRESIPTLIAAARQAEKSPAPPTLPPEILNPRDYRPEDYPLELANARLAREHQLLSNQLHPQIQAFTRVDNGAFVREIVHLHEGDAPHLPQESLSEEQRRIQAEVAADIEQIRLEATAAVWEDRLNRQAQRFSRDDVFQSELRKMYILLHPVAEAFQRAPAAPSGEPQRTGPDRNPDFSGR